MSLSTGPIFDLGQPQLVALPSLSDLSELLNLYQCAYSDPMVWYTNKTGNRHVIFDGYRGFEISCSDDDSYSLTRIIKHPGDFQFSPTATGIHWSSWSTTSEHFRDYIVRLFSKYLIKPIY